MVFGCAPAAQTTTEAAATEAPAAEATEAAAEATEAPAADEEIVVAGIVFQDDQFMNMLTKGYQDAAADAGVKCLTDNTQNDQAKEVELIKTLGFDGKSIINPRQIQIVNEVFAPTEKAIEKAKKILAAIKEAEKRGSGVIAVNGKMVDRPVVIRAQRTIDLAIASGILTKEEVYE